MSRSVRHYFRICPINFEPAGSNRTCLASVNSMMGIQLHEQGKGYLNMNEIYYGWSWVLWLGVIFVFFSNVGNWGYTYKAHQKYSDLFSRSKAFDILDERFARGEITGEEYTKMKSTIVAHVGLATKKLA
jgi:putative membrane protein